MEPHPAAIVLRDHLLNGIADENGKIDAAIDQLLPVRVYIESEADPSFVRRVEARSVPTNDADESHVAIVGALFCNDSQTALLGANQRLKGELSRLEYAAELLGRAELLNTSNGNRAVLSLKDGCRRIDNYCDVWEVSNAHVCMPYNDGDALECYVSGMHRDRIYVGALDHFLHGSFGNRTSLIGSLVDTDASVVTGAPSKQIRELTLVFPFDSIEYAMRAIGIVGN
jgi:hypothetical protein